MKQILICVRDSKEISDGVIVFQSANDSDTFYTIKELDFLKEEPYTDPLPEIPGTAIWANLKEDPQASLEAFFLCSMGTSVLYWMDRRGTKYYPEDIHTWKPYKDHEPQPYD